MALPTQTAANKEGIVSFQGTDADGLVYTTWAGVRYYHGSGSPNGEVTAPKGSVFIDVGTPNMYQNTDGSTTWELVGGQT